MVLTSSRDLRQQTSQESKFNTCARNLAHGSTRESSSRRRIYWDGIGLAGQDEWRQGEGAPRLRRREGGVQGYHVLAAALFVPALLAAPQLLALAFGVALAVMVVLEVVRLAELPLLGAPPASPPPPLAQAPRSPCLRGLAVHRLLVKGGWLRSVNVDPGKLPSTPSCWDH